MTTQQQAMIDDLRSRGWAVTLWTPEELGTADPAKVEDRLIELAHDVIADLQAAEPCDDCQRSHGPHYTGCRH